MANSNQRNLRVRIKPYLEDLRSRQMTNREAAEILGCNEQALCRMLSSIGFEREPAMDRTAVTRLNAERKAFREKVANDPNMTPEQAAKAANVSLRTIYRYKK